MYKLVWIVFIIIKSLPYFFGIILVEALVASPYLQASLHCMLSHNLIFFGDCSRDTTLSYFCSASMAPSSDGTPFLSGDSFGCFLALSNDYSYVIVPLMVTVSASVHLFAAIIWAATSPTRFKITSTFFLTSQFIDSIYFQIFEVSKLN